MNDEELMALLRAQQEQTIAAVLARVEVPIVRPATVTFYDVVDRVATVVVDGDEDPDVDDDSIEAENLTGGPLFTDDRVMISFQPPHGAFVTAVVGSVSALWVRYDTGPDAIAQDSAMTNLAPGTVDGRAEMFDVEGTTVSPRIPGVYGCAATVSFDPNGTGHRLAEILFNGSKRIIGNVMMGVSDANVDTLAVVPAFPLVFEDGDFIDTRGRQNSGGPLGAHLLHLSLTWVGA